MTGAREVPTVELERAAAARGAGRIVGVDEVGRGALAGPVVAAAVALPWWDVAAMDCLTGVRDSKQLTARRRAELDVIIREVAVAIGLGCAQAETVDVLGIGRATALAMRRALANCCWEPLVISASCSPKISSK
ncbi:MAG: hypothetical protein ACK2UL_02435 [Anaerolineae bacterium]